jgi:hypothetical protein
MSGVRPTVFLVPHITFNNHLSLPTNVAGLRILGRYDSIRLVAASLRLLRHVRRPRWLRHLPNSLPSLSEEVDRGTDWSKPKDELYPQPPLWQGRRRAVGAVSPAPCVSGYDFGRRRERRRTWFPHKKRVEETLWDPSHEMRVTLPRHQKQPISVDSLGTLKGPFPIENKVQYNPYYYPEMLLLKLFLFIT